MVNPSAVGETPNSGVAFEETKKKLDAGVYKAVDIPDMAEAD